MTAKEFAKFALLEEVEAEALINSALCAFMLPPGYKATARQLIRDATVGAPATPESVCVALKRVGRLWRKVGITFEQSVALFSGLANDGVRPSGMEGADLEQFRKTGTVPLSKESELDLDFEAMDGEDVTAYLVEHGLDARAVHSSVQEVLRLAIARQRRTEGAS